MTAAITTQIRARLDAIAAERLRLDDEERRLKKALEALESSTAQPVCDSLGNIIGWAGELGRSHN